MRLRRSGRKKEAPKELSTALSSAAASPPDEPGPIQPPSGSVLGLSSAVGGRPMDSTDEWGLYDPDLAGLGALLSTLDTSAISFPDDPAEDPADLLLRQQASVAEEPLGALSSVLLCDTDEAARPLRAATAVASCRVPHLAPLSMWARVTNLGPGLEARCEPGRAGSLLAQQLPGPAVRNGSQLASTDLAAKIGRLTHPALVAMTGLSPTCRIRGIRTEPLATGPEIVGELPGGSQPDAGPVPESTSIEACGEERVPEEVQAPEEPDQLTAIEPPPEADTVEDLGIIVAPPSLEALPDDLVMDVPPEPGLTRLPDADAVAEITPAAVVMPLVGQDGPAPMHEVPAQEPAPPVTTPPAKKRRRAALALG
jgi:hypothetical protein